MSSAEVGSSRTTRRGLQDHGAGDRDALALAAGELVRVAVAGRAGSRPTSSQDACDDGARARRRRRRSRAAPAPRPTICADRHARAEAAERVLEHDLHLARAAAAARAQDRPWSRPAAERDPALAGDAGAAAPGRAWSCPSRSRRPRPRVWPARTVERHAVDRLDVADRASQQAALDREPDLQRPRPSSTTGASARRGGGSPFGSAASRWRV